MRSRLALTFVGLAVAVLALAWSGLMLGDATDSVLPVLVVGVVALAGAAAAGIFVADRLDHALRDASAQLDDLVSREQAVAVAASHELRTPITALRLSLEDLTLWKQTPPEVTDEITRAIAELDRLAEAVTALLDRREIDRSALPVDIAELTAAVVALWRPRLPAGHDIDLDAPGPMLVRAPQASVQQVLAAMLTHSALRTSDGIEVDVVRLGATVRVRISHADPRSLPTGVIHGTASSAATDGDPELAAAGAVAESMGGYLGVEDSPGTCLVLLVPSVDAPVPT